VFGNIGGGMMAFVSDRDGDNEIFVMAFPTVPGNPVLEYQLTFNEAEDSLPEWSPDGEKIAYASTRDGNWDIYVMDVEDALDTTQGIVLQHLTSHESDDLSPAWSPDGSQIAFASKRDGDWDIYVMDADGTHIRQLTNSPGIETKPSWSPDGSRIAFDSGVDYNRDIYIMDADGSNPEIVVRADGGWPAWSPDGTRIAFFGRLAGNPNIYIVSIDGTNLARMTNNTIDDWEPSWTPDGEWLLYVSGQVPDIFILRADGSESYRLTQDRFEDWTPVWRP
jgi:TolB protein